VHILSFKLTILRKGIQGTVCNRWDHVKCTPNKPTYKLPNHEAM